jgi:protein-S-isoprenylcysteine O-methyltransferase Ste14
MARYHWWKGARGEWYVVIQGGLFLLFVLGPRTWPGLPAWGPAFIRLGSAAGGVLVLIGALVAGAGALSLGKNLTPLPHPKDGAEFVETGAYRFVRHPIYSGIIFMAFGFSLMLHSWLTVGYALLLFAFFEVKSRREERWLTGRFPGYAAYQRRVPRLLPSILPTRRRP